MMNSDRWLSLSPSSSICLSLSVSRLTSSSGPPDAAGGGLWALRRGEERGTRRVSVSPLQAPVSWGRTLSVWGHHWSVHQHHKASVQRSDQVSRIRPHSIPYCPQISSIQVCLHLHLDTCSILPVLSHHIKMKCFYSVVLRRIQTQRRSALSPRWSKLAPTWVTGLVFCFFCT